jgi:hypothetical protein
MERGAAGLPFVVVRLADTAGPPAVGGLRKRAVEPLCAEGVVAALIEPSEAAEDHEAPPSVHWNEVAAGIGLRAARGAAFDDLAGGSPEPTRARLDVLELQRRDHREFIALDFESRPHRGLGDTGGLKRECLHALGMTPKAHTKRRLGGAALDEPAEFLVGRLVGLELAEVDLLRLALARGQVLLPWFVREPPAVASRIDGGGDLSVAVA